MTKYKFPKNILTTTVNAQAVQAWWPNFPRFYGGDLQYKLYKLNKRHYFVVL